MSDTDETEHEPEYEPEPWVRIQKTTFTNWINDKLKLDGAVVSNLRRDLRDGVILCKLMSALRGEKIGRFTEKKNLNQYQAIANLQLALGVMGSDNITLVNIGAEDIFKGNLKLILGMCWSLIRRYQLGARNRQPTKKIMLAWINAVLHPDEVTNFAADWNDGVLLHHLIEYCQPGSAPHWNSLDRMERVQNCDEALSLAEQLFGIPQVVNAENMASGDLDELSGMTYLSYFMAEGGPGYQATLQWVKDTLYPQSVTDFTMSWKSGDTLVDLVQHLDCPLPDLSSAKPEGKLVAALSSSQNTFRIPAFISARDILSPTADHIALMAHIAWLRTQSGYNPDLSVHPAPAMTSSPAPSPELLEESEEEELEEVEDSTLEAESEPEVEQEKEEEGKEDEEEEEEEEEPIVNGVNHYDTILAHDDTESVSEDDISVTLQSEWPVDTPLTLHIHTNDEEERYFKVQAISPSANTQHVPVMRTGPDIYDATLTPFECGIWTIRVIDDDDDDCVAKGPFTFQCFDVSRAEIVRDEDQYTPVPAGDPYEFHVRTADVHSDNVRVHVLHENESLPVEVTPSGSHVFKVTFVPTKPGKHTVCIYIGGVRVKGSVFVLHVENIGVVTAEGQGLRSGSQHHPSIFQINTPANHSSLLDIVIMGPHQLQVPTEVRTSKDKTVTKVTYIPPLQGTYRVEITYNRVPIPESPFYPEVTPARVYVRNLGPHAVVGESSTFTVDAREMATGTLEIDSNLPVLKYKKEAEKIYNVTFIPKSTGKHDIVIKYNNISVSDDPFIVDVTEREEP